MRQTCIDKEISHQGDGEKKDKTPSRQLRKMVLIAERTPHPPRILRRTPGNRIPSLTTFHNLLNLPYKSRAKPFHHIPFSLPRRRQALPRHDAITNRLRHRHPRSSILRISLRGYSSPPVGVSPKHRRPARERFEPSRNTYFARDNDGGWILVRIKACLGGWKAIIGCEMSKLPL